MTTFVYDGKTLAVDSRRTSIDTNSTLTIDDTVKVLTIEPGLCYNGEEVLALAAAGNSRVIKNLVDNFLKLGPAKLPQLYKKVNETGLVDQKAHSGLIFVTNKNGYHFNTRSPDKIDPIDDREDKESPLIFAGGSGRKEAFTLIRLFNVPVILAVAAVELVGKHTKSGGQVQFIKFEDGKVSETGIETYGTTDDIVKALDQHMRSEQCRYLGKRRPLVIRRIAAPVEKIQKGE